MPCIKVHMQNVLMEIIAKASLLRLYFNFQKDKYLII